MTTEVSPPWMDKQLLQMWLRPHFGDITVTGLDVKAATSTGDNFLSDMLRATVNTKDGNSISVIVKCRLSLKAVEENKHAEFFRKEQKMYENTLPRMHALLDKARPGGFDRLSPKCYYSCRSFLVLEDLTTSGFRMLDRSAGMNLKQCLHAMRKLAVFHATSLVQYQEDPESLQLYNRYLFSDSPLPFLGSLTQTFIAEVETWGEEWTKYLDKLRPLQDTLRDHLQRITRPNDSGFNVLGHGDLWVNNMMFQEETDRIRLLDFQAPNYMSPAIDLLYFIYTSPTIDVRVHHTDNLLQEYHMALCDTLNTLGYTQTTPTLQELRKEFDNKSFFGLFTLIVPLAMILSKPGVFNLTDAVKGVTPGPHMYTEYYRKVIKMMLPILERRGAFDCL